MNLSCPTCSRDDQQGCALAMDRASSPATWQKATSYRAGKRDSDCDLHAPVAYTRRDLEPFDPPRFLVWGSGAHRVSLHAPMGVVSAVSTAGEVVAPDDGVLVGWLLARGFPAPTGEDLAWIRSRE